MKTYKAISIEKNDKSFGQVISTTKIGVNKGLSKLEFEKALSGQTWVSFKIEEM